MSRQFCLKITDDLSVDKDGKYAKILLSSERSDPNSFNLLEVVFEQSIMSTYIV